MHCSSELHLVDKVVRASLHEPPLQGPRAPRGGNKGRFVGTGGRRWRAIIIVIIPIKKLIIGPGSPPADPIMGWFSSQPFIPPSLHSFTTEVRLQILSSPPHSPVVKAVAWSWFSAPCRRLWKHSFNMCVKPSMRPKPSNVCDDLHARNIELSLPDPRCAQKLGISGQLLATKSSQAAQMNGWLQKWLSLRECTCVLSQWDYKKRPLLPNFLQTFKIGHRNLISSVTSSFSSPVDGKDLRLFGDLWNLSWHWIRGLPKPNPIQWPAKICPPPHLGISVQLVPKSLKSAQN